MAVIGPRTSAYARLATHIEWNSSVAIRRNSEPYLGRHYSCRRKWDYEERLSTATTNTPCTIYKLISKISQTRGKKRFFKGARV